MKRTYRKNSSPWEATTYPMASGTWKFIVSYRTLAQLHIPVGVDISNTINTWLWTATGRGQFSFHSAWNVAGEPSPVYDFASVIWCHYTCPKMSCSLLRALNNRLLTRISKAYAVPGYWQRLVCSLQFKYCINWTSLLWVSFFSLHLGPL